MRDPLTLVELLQCRAEAGAGRGYLFLAEGELDAPSRMTYEDLDRRARALAACLREAGAAGERILLLFPPGLDFIAAFFGCLYAGGVAVPAYPPRPRRTDPRLAALAADCRPRIVLATAQIVSRAAALSEAVPALAAARWIAVEEAEWEAADAAEISSPAPEDPAFLQYTSGSTGTPKGVVVTHANLVHNQAMIRRAFGQSESSVVVGWLPLYHDMGLIGNVLQPLWVGGECVLMPPVAFLQKPLRWLAAIHRYRATTSGGPNFAYDLCVRKTTPEEREAMDLSSWSVAYNGAEPVRGETLDRFAAAFAPAGFRREAFYPCYGLAEATLFVAGGAAGRGARPAAFAAPALERHAAVPAVAGEGERVLVGCGAAWAGQRIAIADPETGAELPEGWVGEIWVAGPSVAAGYWGRPEDSGELFRASLADGAGPFLRTGDLGFFHGGELFVAGRLKDLIILRGRNHHPQDVERTAEAASPALRAGCGAAFSVEVGGEERLVVVYEVDRHSAAEGVLEAVRQAVAEEHEVQVHEVVLVRTGTVPKTSSGKIRRQACAAAWRHGTLEVVARGGVGTIGADLADTAPALPVADGAPDRYALLSLPVEDRGALLLPWLRGEVARLVRIAPERVDAERQLTALGLDSLAAVELQYATESALGVAVSLQDLLEGTTLVDLSGWLAERLEADAPRRWAPSAGFHAGEHPLSEGQRGLWFLHHLAPTGGAYNLAAVARTEDLDPEALRHALETLCGRHPALRSVFAEREGEAVQRVLEKADLDFAVVDASAWEEESWRRHLAAEAWRPFELTARPPLRIRVWKRPAGAWAVLLAVHHLVADFWSLALLLEELGALAAGAADRLPEPAAAYGDFVGWQRERLAGAEGGRLWEYWRVRLGGGLPVLDLPTDRPRPPVQTFRGASRALFLPAGLAGGLERLGRERGATLFMVLAAVFHALLHRASGQETILVGAPTAGREVPELAGVVGYFTNPVVLRADFPDGDLSFIKLLDAVRRDALGAFAHAAFPFPLLIERLQPERDAGRNPLFQAMLVLQKAHRAGVPGLAAFALGEDGEAVRLGPWTLTPIALPERRSPFDLMLMLAAVEGGLAASLQLAADLFDATTASRLLGHFERLLQGIVADPGRLVGEIELLTPAERQQVLREWNDTDRDLLRDRTLVDLVAEQAERTPEAPALVHGEESLTYRELLAWANGLARHLRVLGVGPEVRVGVCLERHFDLPVSLLAVLAAGGAYVPLDPAYPAERLRFMLDDAAAPVVLTRPGLLEGVGTGVLRVDPRYPHPSGEGALVPGGSGRLAYLIYTSGSTGRPKGVAIEHRSAVALVEWARVVFSREDLACVLFSTSVCFDLSVFELFVPWSMGGAVVLAPDALALPELAAAERVTLINTVPSALEQLVAGPLPAALRVVNLAGEPLPGDLVRRIHARRPDVRVYNLYGPSEDTTYSTGALIPPGERIPSIGRPVAGTRVFLLDRRGAPVPAGAPGEVWLGGAGLARGYLDRPALTAERFMPDSFSGGAGKRLYRTGDLARRRVGGELEFLGRIDHQVKIHGFRIELGEIETALRAHPAVRECVVVARDGRGTGRRLVAYVAGALPPAGATGELQRFLRERLPASLVPPLVVLLEALPRTPNGKVDRRALPEPGVERPELAAAWTAPRDAAEETLAGIWAGVLGIERVGAHDNFFELGGDSILSLQVVARAREAGLRVSAQQLFQHQTVAALAAVAAAAEVAGGGGAAAEATGPAPLTPIQRWFFSLSPEEPWHFNQAVRVRARGALDPWWLEAALEALLQHHDALRLRFAQDTAGAWRQEAVPWSPSSPLAVVDLGALPSASREKARAAAEAVFQTGFDLVRGPLLHGLLVLADGPPHLLLTAHHLVVDGVSWRILLEDLQTAYAGLRRGAAPCLPAKTTSFRDWAERLERLGAGAEADPAPAEETGRAGAARRVTTVLPDLPRSLGADLRDALLAAVVEAFGRRTGERVLRIDVEGHGQGSSAPGVDLSRTVGWLTALSTVVLDLNAARSAAEAVRRVRAQIAAAGRGPGQDRSGAPVVFNYLGRLDGALAAESPFATAEIPDVPVQGPRNRRGHAVAIDAWVQDGVLTIRWEHAGGPGGDAAVQELAAACLAVLREIAAAGRAAAETLAADPRLEDVYAVTPLQAGILLHALEGPGTGAYVQQLSCVLEGDFAAASFVDAWQWLVDRHTILRTRFPGRGLDEPLQAVETAARLPVAWDDWSAWPPGEQEGRLAAWLEADRARGFELDRAPLLRLLLARTGPRAWNFVLTYHHLLLDGWALVLLLEELFVVYAELRRGDVPRTPAPAPFRELIDWLRRQDPAPAEAAWRQAVSGFSVPTPLAADRPVALPGAPRRHGEERLSLSAVATGALAAAARRHQLTQGTLVQAAWGVLLGRLSGEEDLIFGAVTSGRSADLPGMEHRVGLFINTLPMRLAVRLEAPLLPWLREVQARAAEVLRHEHTPLVEIQAWSGVAPGRRLFDSILAFENYPLDEALARRAGGLAVSGVRFIERIDYPLAVVVAPGERMALQMIYDHRLFAPATVARRLEHLRRLLEGLAAALSGPGALSGARLADLPWLSAAERHQVLHEWNDTCGPVPSGGRLIHQLFEARAAAQGETVAVVADGEILTYAELDRRAGRLARRLRGLGVGRGSLVAVHLGRSAGMVVAVLAILKAGGAYVPMEVALPPARVRWIAGFLGLRWAVTEAALRDGLDAVLDGLVPRSCLVAVDREEKVGSGAPLAPLAGPDDPAYVIFTSGSTGTPKGVVVSHRPVINLIEWVNGTFGVGPADRVLFITALSFDLSVYDVFGLLAAGGSIHVAAERDVREPARLVRLLVEEPVTFWDSAPAALQQLVPFLPAEPVQGAALRLAFLSGDWIPLGIKDEVTAAFPRLLCVGLGGATEATIWSNVHRIETVEPQWRSIPYGRPIRNARYHVLDAELEPMAVGVAGDLYIGGPVLARGYAGEPVVTAEKFVPDPFATEPGAVLYRTGDRARHFADGRLEFLGRLDHQVKIRGYRIELGEIEAALGDHPGVREALVLAREDAPGDHRLVAYVVPGVASAPNPGELRAWLTGRLPVYMVPSAFAILETWPVTANGKVDRNALPAPESMGAAAGEPVEERTATPVEELVASQWAEVLRLPVARAVRLDESFFELGGHSLLATRLLARLREVLGVELPLRTFFDHPTVAGQAAEIERILRAGEYGELPPLEPVPRGGDLVLSFGQLRLWFLHQLEPASPAYNVRGALRLSGRLRAEVLERSLEELVRRHEMLRTSFPSVAGEAVQRIAPPAPFPLPVADLSALPAAAVVEEEERLAGAEGRRPFDLAAGPLLRALLVRRAAAEHLLLLNLHHIISDGWSMNVLVDEAAALYAAFAGGGPNPLPEPALQYADYAAWQRGRLDGEILERQLAWWRRELAGAPAALDLSTDRPRPAVRSGRGETLLFALPADLTEAVRALARRHGTTLFMAHLAAFAALLTRWSGQEDVVVGTPIANRGRVETEGMVGFLVNTLALRVQVSGDLPFAGLLTRVREAALGAFSHQELPFERLVDALQPERDPSRTPLFQVCFSLDTAMPAAREVAGLRLEPAEVHGGAAKFDLTLALSDCGAGGMTGHVEYTTDLFERASIERLRHHYATLLRGAVAAPESELRDLPLLSAAERQELIAAGAVRRVFASGEPLHRGFERQARLHPEAVAVVDGEERWSYAQVNRRSNRLARRLRSLGVGPESRVGLCAERSAELVVGILGILKAGGSYVPADPGYPPDRIGWILTDAWADVAAPVLVAQRRVLSSLPPPAVAVAQVVCLEDDPAGVSSEDLPGCPGADSLAYVIYTSGSTGHPKGVEVTHRNVARLLKATEPWFGFGADDVWTLFHSYAFDFSVWEIWGALHYGGRLVVVPYLVSRSPEAFYELLVAERVTVLNQTPSAFRQLAAVEEGRPSGALALRFVVFGGEALELASLRGWLERHGEDRPQLINMYGITETTVHVTFRRVRRSDLEAGGSRIGMAIPDLALYLLDRWQNPLPVGVAGEICVGGAGLSRGYLHRPELTAARLIPDAFSGVPGGRLYRSGDLARLLPDGEVEYLGRIDHQVKVRGFRIELGEIEGVLAAYPEVREAVVLAREDTAGDRRLVAYVVPAAGAVPVPRELRSYLQDRLPHYMVPAAWVFLGSLPMTPNGKVDRKALPAPDGSSQAWDYVEPRTQTERELATIWAEVLGVAAVGAGDSFFELGGHSLLATRVMSRLLVQCGVDLPLRALFETPALAALAARVEAARKGGVEAFAPIPACLRGEPLPLSPAQRRLWILDRQQPGDPTYNMPLPVRLGGRLDAALLRRALHAVTARHAVLRTRIVEGAEGPVQEILPVAGAALLPQIDLSALPAARREGVATGLAAADGALGFDLAQGPLARFTLVRLAAEDHLLLATLHHLAGDGWSMGVLVREVAWLLAGGGTAELATPPVRYADWAAWQAHREAVAEDAGLDWWRRRLAGAPELRLPVDRDRRAVGVRPGGFLSLDLADATAGALHRWAATAGASLAMALLAGYAALLARLSGQDDLVLGLPLANRGRPEVEGVIGFFVNTLPLRCDLAGDPVAAGVLERVRDEVLALQARQETPFERLIGELPPDRRAGEAPFFRTVVTLERSPLAGLAVPGLTFSPWPVHNGTAKFDLTLTFVEIGRSLTAGLEYGADRIDRTRAQRLLGQLATVLAAAAATPECPLSHLPLLTAAERHQVVEWNDTATAWPADRSVHQLFAAQAAAAPDAEAAVCGGAGFTYRELDLFSSRLARRLAARGVRRGSRVGILAERSLDLLAGLLAILKAGGAYVPLDPSYPAGQLESMAADADLALVLAQPNLAVMAPGGWPVAFLDDADDDGGDEENAAPPPDGCAGPDDLVYVLYTSGSTGRPKGVEVPHRAVVRLVRETSYVRLGRGEVLLHMAPLAFDASTLEIWGALLTGGCVVVMPPGNPSLADLAREVERCGVTTLWLTAGLFHLAVDEHPEILAGLRQLLAGGDVLSAPHVRRALELLPPGARLINGYGPTESTTFACCHSLSDPAEVGASVLLGRPIANTRAVLLDRALELVPAGVSGELCIGGDGLARGYLGRPELTAERFVPHPQGTAGERLYRTGDLASWLPDGRLGFLGRFDAQVKIRGFRVEPGEVEAVLARHPSVRDAVVAVRRDAMGERRLAAYLVLREPGGLAAVRSFASRTLLQHMVPADWTELERIPLTPNGKVDRAGLPAPPAPAPAAPTVPLPASPVAEILAGIWDEVLRLDGAAPAGDFYALGGHSLLATQVVARVRATFGVDVPLRALLEEPALEDFARVVEEEIGRGRRAVAVPPIVPVPRDGGSPLSLAQRRLWFLDRLEPGNPAYNIPAALRITGELAPAVLAASLAEIVRRHETLRSSFPESGGVPVQHIAPPSAVPLPVADLSALAAPLREPLAAELLAAENLRPFDLLRGPLLRALLFCLAPQEHLAVLTVHHAVSDGWSMEILVRELGEIYAALAAGRPSPLSELPFQYSDYAAWQQGWLEEEIQRHQLPYWRERLAGAPAVLDLPIARARRNGRFRSGLTIALLPGELCRGLRSLARRQRATYFMVLLAGWKALLALLSGQTDLLVGVPIANRHRREIEELIGFFVNTLVLRTSLAGNPTFNELLARVCDTTLEAHAHQDLSFDRLVEELDPPRVPGRNPLFQVLFDMLSFRGATAGLQGLRVEILPLVEQTAKFDMTLYVADGGESTVLRLAYDADRFEAAAMESLLADYRALLERAVSDPEALVSALLRPQEHQEAVLLAAFNESLDDFQEV